MSPEYGKDPQLTYNEYLKVDELLQLQRTLSDPLSHDELLFIIIHQTYELWFKQILHELDATIGWMNEGRAFRVNHSLRAVIAIEKVMITQIHILESMAQIGFLEFRDKLNPASGFQSVQFRELEFVSGQKDAKILDAFKKDEYAYERLQQRFEQPTIADAFWALLGREGFAVAVIIDWHAIGGLFGLVVLQIMRGVHAAKCRPRMQHTAMLRIVFGINVVKVRVKPALIAVIPEENRRMVHVAFHHFLHQLRTDDIVVVVMPAADLIEDVKTQLIAQIQKLLIRRIVRHADGVHVRIFHRVDVKPVDSLAQAAPGIRPERMAVGTFENYALTVEVKAVTIAHFKCAEAKTLRNLMDDLPFLLEAEFDTVQIWRLRRPKLWCGDLSFQIQARSLRAWGHFGRECLANIFTIKRLDLRPDFIGIGCTV